MTPRPGLGDPAALGGGRAPRLWRQRTVSRSCRLAGPAASSPDAGPLQIVQLDDVVATVLFFLRPDAPSRSCSTSPARSACRSTRCSSPIAAGSARRARARLARAAAGWCGAAYRLGDLVGLLGWRPPLRTTARRELVRGAVGDPRAMDARSPASSRARSAPRWPPSPPRCRSAGSPSSISLKPLTLGCSAALLDRDRPDRAGPRLGGGRRSVQEAGSSLAARWRSSRGASPTSPSASASPSGAPPGRRSRRRWRCRLSTWLLATLLLPGLWADPLGPLLKILPILVLNLVALAILDDR